MTGPCIRRPAWPTLTGAPKAREGSRQRLYSAQQTLPAARVTGEVLQDRELAAPRSEVGVGASPPRTLPTARPLVSPLQLSPRTLPRASAVPSPLQCGSFPRLEEPCRHCRWPPCLSGQCEREWRDLAAAVQKDELTVRRMIVPRSVTRRPQTRALPMRLRLGGQLPKRKSANQLRPSAMAAQQVGQMSRTLGCPEGGHR